MNATTPSALVQVGILYFIHYLRSLERIPFGLTHFVKLRQQFALVAAHHCPERRSMINPAAADTNLS